MGVKKNCEDTYSSCQDSDLDLESASRIRISSQNFEPKTRVSFHSDLLAVSLHSGLLATISFHLLVSANYI